MDFLNTDIYAAAGKNLTENLELSICRKRSSRFLFNPPGGNILFFEALTDTYFEPVGSELIDGGRLAVHILDEHKSILGRTRLKLLVLYYLRQRQINFDNAQAQLYAYFQHLDRHECPRIDSKWIVMGSAAGIYLFDELKNHSKLKGISSHICTIDSDDGKTFFAPGMDINYRISSLFEDLFLRANTLSKQEFAMQFIRLLDQLIPCIGR